MARIQFTTAQEKELEKAIVEAWKNVQTRRIFRKL